MKPTRIHILIGLAIILLIIVGGIYVWYFNKQPLSSNQPLQTTSTNSTSSSSAKPSTITTAAPSTTTTTSSITELQLPSLAELQAEAAGWPTYTKQKHGINIKYPSGWNHYDENHFPYGVAAQIINYKATEIFNTHTLFGNS